MTTKMMADSESLVTASYKCSLETFSLSRTIFELFAIFFIMGFPILGTQNCFSIKLPLNGQVSTELPKGTCLHENKCFGKLGAAVWRAVRRVSMEKKVSKKNQVVYMSPHRPDDP